MRLRVDVRAVMRGPRKHAGVCCCLAQLRCLEDANAVDAAHQVDASSTSERSIFRNTVPILPIKDASDGKPFSVTLTRKSSDRKNPGSRRSLAGVLLSQRHRVPHCP